SGSVPSFPLAEHDPPSRFELHQGFYGRELELKKLRHCFQEATQGRQQAVVVTGYAGVGKTSLVQELKKTVLARQGWFLAGKYGALERETPYSGIREALLDSWRQISADRRELAASFRASLEKALGPNLGVIAEVVPEMKNLFGELPPVLELDPIESKNRFHLCFLRALQALASKEHPLVLFLDDLQWADPSSLELLESILERGVKHFLLVGTYRNNELHPPNTLLHSIKKIRDRGIAIETLTVGPLELHDLRQFVADSLRTEVPTCAPLADLVFQKSGGNPFFAKAFLTNIVEEGLLCREEEKSWRWDLTQIAGHQAMASVLEVTRKKIDLIGADTRQTIAMAAALGRPLELPVLAAVCGKPVEQVEADLIEACRVRILIKTENGYQFEHDRLQESAYALIPEAERGARHLAIGRIIAGRWGASSAETTIFTVLDHLNRAPELLDDPEERKKTISLNLTAGRKARSAAAFPAAYHYFVSGLRLLDESCWQENYELTLALHTRAAEAACLTANFREADRLAQQVLTHARTLLGKIPAYETLIAVNNAKLLEAEAFRITLEVTRLLGIDIPPQPTAQEVKGALLATQQLAQALLASPLPTAAAKIDVESRAAMKLLARAALSAGTVHHNLYLVITHKLFELASRFPASPEAPVAFVMAGGILCYLFDEHEQGFRIADLGVELQSRSGSPRWQSLCHFLLTVDINCWRQHFDLLVDNFITAYRLGLQTGDLMTASTGAYYS
ncbi:MAG: AAA family ATPase, partial [Desulfuromonadales bacterium]|nr:AAA family ATPase [Desulfuromonadales bacterium]